MAPSTFALKCGEVEPTGARQRPCQKTEPGDEAGAKHPKRAPAEDEPTHRLKPLGRDPDQAPEALDYALPPPSPDPIAKVIAHHGADNADRENQRQPQLTTPHEVTSREEGRLFGHGQSNIPQDDDHEDGEVAPVSNQLADIKHRVGRPALVARHRLQLSVSTNSE